MLKTYGGSRHCGAARIEADLDTSAARELQLSGLREDAALVDDGEARRLPTDRRGRRH